MKWEPAHTNPQDVPTRTLRMHHRLIIAAIIILCLALIALASKRLFSPAHAPGLIMTVRDIAPVAAW